MTKVGILGASGRMGQMLIKNIQEENTLTLTSIFAKEPATNIPNSCTQYDNMQDFLSSCDGIIDFSLPDATEEMLNKLLDSNMQKFLVIGTTGFTPHQQNLLKQVSHNMPILYASNMSLGVAMLNKVVSLVSAKLKDFDCEIVEQHHKHKKDAPSGTALTLAHTAANARELDLDKVRVSGRDGHIGARTEDEIGVLAVRGGDIVGRHTVGFYNDGEFLELNHTATSRETFSKGAVSAFKWLSGVKQSGLYNINDFLGL